MFMLLALAGAVGVAALVDVLLEDEDSSEAEAKEEKVVVDPDDPVEPVEDIDGTSFDYNPEEHAHLVEDFVLEDSIVILNDEILAPSGETEDGSPIYDLSGFDAETDRIAVLEPVSHYESFREASFDVARTEDGDLIVSGAVLQGVEELPRGALELHLVEEDFIEEGDTAFTLDESEIVASYEIISGHVGGEGDDSYRPDGQIELFSLTDLEGQTQLTI